MDVEICYVQNLTVEAVWFEEKDPLSSCVLTVILYRISEDMTGTDKDGTGIDTRLLVSFCCENSVALYLYGKLW
jgi:hypothetical protein